MEYLWCLIGFVIGGILPIVIRAKLPPDGILKIDTSNPEKHTYRFEIDDLDKLTKKKRFVLKVDSNADLSRN